MAEEVGWPLCSFGVQVPAAASSIVYIILCPAIQHDCSGGLLCGHFDICFPFISGGLLCLAQLELAFERDCNINQSGDIRTVFFVHAGWFCIENLYTWGEGEE